MKLHLQVLKHTVPLKKMEEIAKDPRFGNKHALLLFENPEDVLRAIKGGINLKDINVGSMSYKEGDVNANNVLSMNQEDVDTFRELEKMGVKFDVRKVPSDAPGNMDAILKKAQNLLDEQKK